MTSASADDLKDVIDFLKQAIPFSSLPESELLLLARQLSIEYLPERTRQPVTIENCIYLVRSGAFDIVDETGNLMDRIGEGECFGVSSMLQDKPSPHRVYAIEDSLVFRLGRSAFSDLIERHKSLSLFFEKLVGYRASSNDSTARSAGLDVQHTRSVSTLIQNRLVYCSVQSSIREAAEIMRENKVSCLLLVEQKRLQGIVTDRDLRNRVVAADLSVDRPITDIATMTPQTIRHDATIIEAQMLMSNAGIHHLPVIRDGLPIGVVTATDIVRAHSVSLVHYVDRIFRESSPAAVARLQQQIPDLLDNWIQADVSPLEIGESFSVIGDAFVRKAIQLAQMQMPPAPMAFTWLSFGSQARKDQSFASDQDNGLILERTPDAGESAWFADFTDRVCHLLDDFGYPLCPGDIMASNPKWRRTRQGWSEAFRQWIATPEPEALLHASIFFDMRVIYGDTTELDLLKADLADQLKSADLFFMHMTRNALRSKPPIGFFRSFIVNDSGDHENEFDIKHRGAALINDMARIIALVDGHLAAGTAERLRSSSDTLLQKPLRDSLLEAWLLLAELKLETQMQQLKDRAPVTNYLNPDALSPLRRAYLKNAFQSIERAQKALAQHFLRGAGG